MKNNYKAPYSAVCIHTHTHTSPIAKIGYGVLSLFFMFAIILDIEAQTWTPGAAGAPEITTTGKVGVGTTVPEGKI